MRDAVSARNWMGVIFFIVSDNSDANQKIFGTEQVRGAFVVLSKFATTTPQNEDGALKYWVGGVMNLTQDNEDNQKLFGTTDILKCFVAISKVAASNNHCGMWCWALRNIVQLKANQKLFGTKEIRESMIRVSKYLKYDHAPRDWLLLLDVITEKSPTNKKLFLVDSLLAAESVVRSNNRFEGIF